MVPVLGRNEPPRVNLRHIVCCGLLAITGIIAGCGRSERYTNISLGDPCLAEFSDLRCVNQVLGFPPLPPTASVAVDRKSWPSRSSNPDATLYIYAKHQSRYVEFRRASGVMRCVTVQVSVDGPRQYTTAKGTFNEFIALTYPASLASGMQGLVIQYHGPDQNLASRNDIGINEVTPLLNQWLARP
jgi:hypothetical protein